MSGSQITGGGGGQVGPLPHGPPEALVCDTCRGLCSTVETDVQRPGCCGWAVAATLWWLAWQGPH